MEGHDVDRRGSSTDEKRPQTTVERCPKTAPCRGSYKPTPLKWPFLAVQILLFVAAIAAMVVIQTTSPDSDDSTIVDGRPLLKLVRRADDGTETTTESSANGISVSLLSHQA